MNNVTDNTDIVGKLAAANAALNDLLANINQGVAAYGTDETLEVFNRRYAEIYGLPAHVLKCGMKLRAVVQVLTDAGCFDGRSADDVYTAQSKRLRHCRPDGFIDRLRANKLVSMMVRHKDLGGWAITLEDVTERQTAPR